MEGHKGEGNDGNVRAVVKMGGKRERGRERDREREREREKDREGEREDSSILQPFLNQTDGQDKKGLNQTFTALPHPFERESR